MQKGPLTPEQLARIRRAQEARLLQMGHTVNRRKTDANAPRDPAGIADYSAPPRRSPSPRLWEERKW